MLRPNLSISQSVPLVDPRELLGSLTTVRVLAGENGEDVATSVDIPIPHTRVHSSLSYNGIPHGSVC